MHRALQQHTLLHEKNAIAHDLQPKPSLLKRLASKAGFVSDSAHEETSPASTAPSGNASQTLPTGLETNDADTPADEVMLTDPQSHEPESPRDLPAEALSRTQAVPALNHAQRQIANRHTVSSVHKDKESNGSHVAGRLDRDIAYMVWCESHKRASQLRHALPRRSNQRDDSQPANDQPDGSQPADNQLDEFRPLGDGGSGGVQLPGVQGSLPGAEGDSWRAECSLSGAARNALGAKGDAHGAEGSMYMHDELSAEQKAAAEMSSNSNGGQHEKRLPDEVLVEQAKQWAGRYGSITLGLLLCEAMCT